MPDAIAAFGALLDQEDPFWRLWRERAGVVAWEVGGNPGARVLIRTDRPDGALDFWLEPGARFAPRVDQLPVLRRIDDAMDGYLFACLERHDGASAWLRDMIHRDRTAGRA